jgi:hypothetical protein
MVAQARRAPLENLRAYQRDSVQRLHRDGGRRGESEQLDTQPRPEQDSSEVCTVLVCSVILY